MRRGAKPLICFLSRWNASSHSRLRFSTQTETDNCYARVKKVSSIQPDLRVAGRWCSQCRKTAWWRRRPRRGLPVPHGESGLASPAGTLVRTSHLTSSQLRHNVVPKLWSKHLTLVYCLKQSPWVIEERRQSHIKPDIAHSLRTNTIHPLRTNTIHPLKTNTTHPLRTNTIHPSRTNTTHPLRTNTICPWRTGTTFPRTIHTSHAPRTETCHPLRTDINHVYVYSLQCLRDLTGVINNIAAVWNWKDWCLKHKSI